MADDGAVTWDGQLRATDNPRGCTVVVRRPGREQPEYLVLHRAVNGPEFTGDWAWTAPSGCRHPGESVHGALLRELAEEVGITAREPALIDTTLPAGDSGTWALFALDVEAGFEPTLVDPEHDRFVWTHAAAARELIKPDWVAANQIGRVHDLDTYDLHFTPATADDIEHIVRWRAAEHVRPWWYTYASDDEVRDLWRGRLEAESTRHQWIVSVGGFPAGWCTAYRLADVPELATKAGDVDGVAFDYAVGEPALAGQGLGTQMVWALCRDVLPRTFGAVPRYVAAPSHRNLASRRLLTKCGFSEGVWFDAPVAGSQQPDTDIAYSLDVAHWFGGPAGGS